MRLACTYFTFEDLFPGMGVCFATDVSELLCPNAKEGASLRKGGLWVLGCDRPQKPWEVPLF